MVKLNLDTPVALEKLETFADGLDHSEGIAITPNGDLFVGGNEVAAWVQGVAERGWQDIQNKVQSERTQDSKEPDDEIHGTVGLHAASRLRDA